MDGIIEQLYSAALNPTEFLRESGDALAHADARWKAAYNRGLPTGDCLREMIHIGLAHVEALGQCDLNREALQTMVSMLISIDMAKVDIVYLGECFITLHEEFLQGCASLCRACQADSYAAPHAIEILRHEARLFLHFTSPKSESLKIRGLRRACSDLLGDDRDATVNVSETLIDIFSRLHAIST